MELDNKEERILEAAAEVFADQGFFKATVIEIAEQADIAKGTIYLYFDSKQDLFKSLIVSRVNRLYQGALKDKENKSSFEAKIKSIITRELNYFAEEADLSKSIISGFSGMDEEFKKAFCKIRKKYRGVIKEIIQSEIEFEAVEDVASDDAVRALQGIIHSFGFDYYLTSTDEDSKVEELTDIIYNLFINGISEKN
ncbi:TetR/AcrR family transcriptional regulator [Acetohalobium arabaticum]|uniref:Transcriptional regulator, TetR family n=1 Tax=Acetohalobium arabaticum (strain ATCC 49924 / DSM 5501 / Z-7288) TaxID=574087 RepID=D9QS66_ACEAZ|nr:TetR/AcrR family transcriptional regulator [Acetohalobium arabaticum]ADL13357.1 transcriptional regulator, TetR family [Acetohalobium arabaticum DSM 5501]